MECKWAAGREAVEEDDEARVTLETFDKVKVCLPWSAAKRCESPRFVRTSKNSRCLSHLNSLPLQNPRQGLVGLGARCDWVVATQHVRVLASRPLYILCRARRSCFVASLLEDSDDKTQVLPLTPVFCTYAAVSIVVNLLRLQDACDQLATCLRVFSSDATHVSGALLQNGFSKDGENLQQIQHRHAACAALRQHLLIDVLKTADFLDIESVRSSALLEVMERIRQPAGGALQYQKDSMVMDAILSVVLTRSRAFHHEWRASCSKTLSDRYLCDCRGHFARADRSGRNPTTALSVSNGPEHQHNSGGGGGALGGALHAEGSGNVGATVAAVEGGGVGAWAGAGAGEEHVVCDSCLFERDNSPWKAMLQMARLDESSLDVRLLHLLLHDHVLQTPVPGETPVPRIGCDYFGCFGCNDSCNARLKDKQV